MSVLEGDILAPAKTVFGRPQKFTDAEKFKTDVQEYFDIAEQQGKVPTITGLAVYLDTDRKTLQNYKSKDEFLPSIKMALSRCEAAVEQLALQGKLNPAMSIFTLKNNYGWVDKSEVDNKHEVVTPILGAASKQSVDDSTLTE